jgi:hypothetical protein
MNAKVLIVLAISSSSSGDVTFRFVTPQAEYSAAPGGMVTVPVLLEETVTGASTSLLVTENGLFSAGVRVSRTGTLPGDPALFAGPNAVNSNTLQFYDASNPVFAPVVTVEPDGAGLLEFARAAGVIGSQTSQGVRVIALGNFNITVGSVLGEGTMFQVGDYAATSDTVTWTNSLVLDEPPDGIAGSTFTVTVVNPGCYANCDGSTVAPILSANDFQCFLSRFGAGDVYANCDGSTTPPILNANDFACFINKFAAGCT